MHNRQLHAEDHSTARLLYNSEAAVQAMNFSGAELDILQRFSQAAEETDEDWCQDNIS